MPIPPHNPLFLAPPAVLSFAASDPTGGAGIQADLMTVSSLGCHALSVLTAITVQDTAGVSGILPLDADWVEDQARTLLEDMPVAAFKIGLLGSVENIAIIAEILADYPNIPLVLDPVLASGRGDELANEEMIAAICELLLPQTTVLTPNSLEARRLSDSPVDEDGEGIGDVRDDMRDEIPDNAQGMQLSACASHLLDYGCEYVLITGTHENTPQVSNTLYHRNGRVRRDTWNRLPGSYHGSGCTLASAIAANLANGLSVPNAVRDAQEYTWQTLAAGYRPGMGQHIPDRFFRARAKARDENNE